MIEFRRNAYHRTTILCLVLTVSASISAWTLPRLPMRTHRSSIGSLPATVDDSITASTISASGTTITSNNVVTTKLLPEFQAVTDAAQAKLLASIPEAYHAKIVPLLAHFVNEYMTASQNAYLATGNPSSAPEQAASRILQGVGYGVRLGLLEPFQFSTSHVALRGKNPELEQGNEIDFYEFGCEFFRTVMDLERSVVLGQDQIPTILQQLADGENVVLLANHQSEADPQVVSCCLEAIGYGDLAADAVYVAGHKVTTDPLAIPFSMGRNLICIHSKKHINADPETKSVKQRENLKAMGALLNKFKEGGALLWVAPSGGRDRRDVTTGKVPLAPFDSKTIDMFRLMGNKSKKTTHFYTLAMVSYDLCPPPDVIEPGTGEPRNVRFGPVGIALGAECISVGGLESRQDFCQHAFAQCQDDYLRLQQAIANPTTTDQA
jgi:glycerol-3-phosphate O-acyltransferase